MMDGKVMATRIRVGSSAAREQAASRPNEKSGRSTMRLANFVKAVRRSDKAGTVSVRSAAVGASDSELVALKYRSVDQQLLASKTAAYVAMYGGW
jgi:hypothetical protein